MHEKTTTKKILNRAGWFICLCIIVFFSTIDPLLANYNEQLSIIEKARILFYKSVDDKKYIDQAIENFNQVATDTNFTGLAQTYIGALTALRGKHAFWPQDKLDWTMKGLAIMDSGLVKSPDDLEALFIHSSTCYYLPFFFKRGEQAQVNMKTLSRLIPIHINKYDHVLMGNVIRFILENGKLPQNEKMTLEELLSRLEKNEI